MAELQIKKKKKKPFSDEQLSAINTRDRTLLVSAAAGSGKTTTLTERIIRSLLDNEHPESLSNMLIVTFTNASVADMKEKISEALTAAALECKERAEENPACAEEEKIQRARLERELFMLPSARICTIDSFCNEVLRRNAEYAGITPGYRIAETAEASILATSILDSLINAIYEGEHPEIATALEFSELCDCLTSSKTTGSLAEILYKLYEKSTSALDGIKMFGRLIEIYEREWGRAPEDTTFGAYLMLNYKETLEHAIKTLTTLLSDFDSYEYERDLNSDLEIYEKLREIKSYELAREYLSTLTFPRMTSVKGEKSDELIFVGETCKKMREAVKSLYEDFFLYTASDWENLYSEMYRVLSVLKAFLERFDELYVGEKIRRGMLEYSDIERLALSCLYNPDPKTGDALYEISDIAKSYRDSFSSVYIDEYQDVNELQNAIFAAVSKPTNRFMVGDIKQSIYSFRSARPEIFAKMKSTYPQLQKSDGSPNASVFMSNNYRCDEVIIDFVNAVFDTAFTITGESIGYTKGDRLKFAKHYDDGKKPERRDVEITVFPGAKRGRKKGEEAEDADDTLPVTEAEWIAEKIEALLSETVQPTDGGEPTPRYKPRDIAILLRKNKSIEAFSAALAARNIPSVSKDTGDFFLNAEVLLALSLLNAIDNPSRDIYLAALMCSPLYGFAPDDLVKIRRTGTGGRLYGDLKAYCAEHPEDKKCAHFITELTRYRTLSEGMTADALIARLYRETGLLALASKHGGEDNLMLLYNYARKFEGSSYKGLYSFISYINNIIEENKKFEDKPGGISDENAVKIMTVHSSKGLEFPVVFFAEAGKPFKNLDKSARFAYSEDYGLALYLRVTGGLALVRNPVQHVIHLNMDKKFIEEELRVLYVALTRARERLYITGAAEKNDVDAYLSQIRLMRQTQSHYQIIKCRSYLTLILSSIKPSDAKINYVEPKAEDGGEETLCPEEKAAALGEENGEKVRKIYEKLSRRFNFSYPRVAETALPEKLSVSHLNPRVLDGDDTSDEIEMLKKERITEKKSIIPAFYSGKREDEAALAGVATHTALQFCDLLHLKRHGTDAELERLYSEGFITKEQLSRINRKEIELFKNSEFLTKMTECELYREFRFNCYMPARIFTTDTERAAELGGTEVLVQGVIDCMLFDSDGEITLIDYKTDRLTKAELENKPLAYEKLYKKHSEQLYYYSLAIERIFGRAPRAAGIYSLPLGEFLEFKLEAPKKS